MVNEILTSAGVTHTRGRFIERPKETYAVYFDDIEVDAADPVAPTTSAGLPRIYTHNISIEVYEPIPDDATESAIEAELNSRGLSWSKQDRYWLKDLQRYQVVYEFSYTSKS